MWAATAPHPDKSLAESEGFEPPTPCGVVVFGTTGISQTRPTLHWRKRRDLNADSLCRLRQGSNLLVSPDSPTLPNFGGHGGNRTLNFGVQNRCVPVSTTRPLELVGRLERPSAVYRTAALPVELYQQKLEPTSGIEPESAAYRAAILPLNYKGSGASAWSRTTVTRLRGARSTF